MLLSAFLLSQALASADIETTIVNTPHSPVHIDTCVSHLDPQDPELFDTSATLHNVSHKRIRVIGLTLFPYTAFNDRAGDPRENIFNVDLAPGEEMGEDYPFTDGSKDIMVGIGWSPQTYVIKCMVMNVRFADGTVWKF